MREGVEMRLTINGEDHVTIASPWATLADVLREGLALRGTRTGCKEGECGSCTVLMDGQPIRSCLTLAAQAQGYGIMTIEGYAADPHGRAIQQAFVDHFAAQCGFCTAGMLAVVRHYLDDASVPEHGDEASIRTALDAVACRCTGYQPIVAAVKALAAVRRAQGHG